MKLLVLFVSIITAAVTWLPLVSGQTFSTGSDGSYGAIDAGPSDGPIDMGVKATEGIFRCTTVRVRPGSVLRFKRNPLNTPGLPPGEGRDFH